MSKEAMRLKEKGNVCFREKRYHKAIELYTQSLNLELSAVVLANRAQSYLNLQEWTKAIMDCNRALEIDSKMEKALYRRAQALEKIGLKASARKDLKRCLEIASNSTVEGMIRKLGDQVDAEMINVLCVDKGDEIRSDSEFVEIIIDIHRRINEGKCEKKDSPASVSEQPNNDAVVAEPIHFAVPTTLRQFFKDYRELERLPPENFAKYFLSISPLMYSSLFGDLMETEMISRLIRGLLPLLISSSVNASQATKCLSGLVEVPRFELLVMFLGDDEKKDLARICFNLPESEAVFIREKYHLEES